MLDQLGKNADRIVRKTRYLQEANVDHGTEQSVKNEILFFSATLIETEERLLKTAQMLQQSNTEYH